MGRRGKVVLARITNERKRRETLRKRKAGLLKKVSELTILCDLEAAVVIYSRGEFQPTIWPSTSEARSTISKFLRRPVLERKARSHTRKSLIAQKCKRLKNKAERLKKKNDNRIIQALITLIYDERKRIQDLDAEHKKKMSDFADERKKELLKHIRRLKRKEQKATHQPQALPPVLQMSGAANGLSIKGLAVGRYSASSAAAAHGQLMIDRATNSLDMTGKAASRININALADGRNFLLPAEGHGQEMNLRGMKQAATIPLPQRTPNLLVMVPNNLTGDRLNMTGVYGQTTIGCVMQHTLPSSLFMPPTDPFTTPIQAPYPPQTPPLAPQFPLVHQPANGLNINYLTGGRNISCRNISSPAATTQGQLMNLQAENRLDMTERFYGQTNIGRMMRHPLPSPSFMPPFEPFAISNAQSMASGLDTTNDGFINESTRMLTGDGQIEERIQHASPPFLPMKLPRRLGLPPVPLMQHDASVIDMLSNENRWNTIGFTKPGTTSIDQSSFGDEYSWIANEFPEPATPGLNQSNFWNGTSNGIWDDLDTAFEVNTEPHWWRGKQQQEKRIQQQISSINKSGFYTVLLEKNDELITAATIRVNFCWTSADLPSDAVADNCLPNNNFCNTSASGLFQSSSYPLEASHRGIYSSCLFIFISYFAMVWIQSTSKLTTSRNDWDLKIGHTGMTENPNLDLSLWLCNHQLVNDCDAVCVSPCSACSLPLAVVKGRCISSVD
ncbi:hypothetical protein POM88_017910 [Heracleum sosnowskyi]|uniref:MADS-box domain-containing protein n=1 Tax=Heracleum sosnowskyi TaxID=360622 RepID=A0AAD8MYQ6_9APIA|nr:hypothetical protein POM88_017910 [Heracleum sosnowskyi]